MRLSRVRNRALILKNSIPVEFGGVTFISYNVADANANLLLVDFPAGGVLNVPVLLGALSSTDFGYFAGQTFPAYALEDIDGDGAIYMSHSADDIGIIGVKGATTEIQIVATTLTFTGAVGFAGAQVITGDFSVDGALGIIDGSTSVRLISAGFTSLESPANRFGLNATEYMQIETAVTTGITTISHTGTTPQVAWAADSFLFTGDVTITPVVTGLDIGSASSYGISLLGTYENAIRITMSKAVTAQAGVRLLNTYTKVDGYHLGLMGAVIILPDGGTGSAGAIGVFGEANIQGIHTGGTNYSFGVRGTLQLNASTDINDGSSIFGAINASMKDTGTPTLTAGHVCGIYVENLIDADLSSISGISSMIYIANNSHATCTVDSAIYLYGPAVTYFAQIYGGTVGGGCIAAAAGAANGAYLTVDVDGVAMKLALLADS